MENELDPKHQDLLFQLCDILKNPEMPAALQHLSSWDKEQTNKESLLPLATSKPSLLQRMDELDCSEDLRTPSTPSEEVTPQKRPRSPLSSESSGRTLMSRLLNPKRRRLSTHISRKSSPSSQLSKSPDPPDREFSISVSPATRAKIYPHKVLGEIPSLMGPTTKTKVTLVQRGGGSKRSTCLGTPTRQPPPLKLATPVAKKPVGYSERITATSPKPSSSSELLTTHLPESLPLSGSESSKENPSTSTTSSRFSTMLSLMKKERVAWETRRSLLESLSQKSESLQLLNGPLRGEGPPKPLHSPFPIVERNSLSMGTTLSPNLQQKSSHPITNSSSMTLPCAMKLQQDSSSSSRISPGSPDYIRQSSYQMESKPSLINQEGRNQEKGINPTNRTSATNSMLAPVKTATPSVNIDTSARIAENPITVKRTVRTEASEVYGLQPKYLRHNLWEQGSTLSPTTAEWSEHAPPLPRPRLSELMNPAVAKTVRDNPHLFKVQTPIKVDVFESLLTHHPNPLFVKSVCAGLREGFWPWADTMKEGYPETHDESRPMPSNQAHANFIREQCFKERSKGYYSPPFGRDLLPGMYSMPIHAVPKPHSDDLRLVTDHSAGRFSLNSMVDHSKVTGFPLDNMRHLGEMLFDVRRSIGNCPLTLWKSDIADAYRLLPMSPLWQAKQIITIDGERHVDRNLCFGNSSSSGIFISFNSLVAWIAKNVKLIRFLLGYVDDSSGCNLQGQMEYYEPYGKYMPTDQC